MYVRQASLLDRTSYDPRSTDGWGCVDGVGGEEVEEGDGVEAVVGLVKVGREAVVEMQRQVDWVMGNGGDEGDGILLEEEIKEEIEDGEEEVERHHRRERKKRRYEQSSPWKLFEKDAEKQIVKEVEYLQLKEQQMMGNGSIEIISNYVLRRTLELWQELSLEKKEHYLELSWCGSNSSSSTTTTNTTTKKIKARTRNSP